MLANIDLCLEPSTACLMKTYSVSPVGLTYLSMSDNCSYVPFEDNSTLTSNNLTHLMWVRVLSHVHSISLRASRTRRGPLARDSPLEKRKDWERVWLFPVWLKN